MNFCKRLGLLTLALITGTAIVACTYTEREKYDKYGRPIEKERIWDFHPEKAIPYIPGMPLLPAVEQPIRPPLPGRIVTIPNSADPNKQWWYDPEEQTLTPVERRPGGSTQFGPEGKGASRPKVFEVDVDWKPGASLERFVIHSTNGVQIDVPAGIEEQGDDLIVPDGDHLATLLAWNSVGSLEGPYVSVKMIYCPVVRPNATPEEIDEARSGYMVWMQSSDPINGDRLVLVRMGTAD